MKVTLILDATKYGMELKYNHHVDSENQAAEIASLVEQTVLLHLGSTKSLPRTEE